MFREKFCENIMTLLQKRGITVEDIEKAVSYSWSHGASTAMYLPHEVFKDLGESGREAFARFVIEGRIRYELNKEHGEQPSDDEVDQALDGLVAMEDFIPMTLAEAENGWMIGRRSIN